MSDASIINGPPQITVERKESFEKQGYRVIGNHSVVKVCEWTRKALRGQDTCYKCKFYGINSWRCVEMSPTFFCDHRCIFCWRDTYYSTPSWIGPVDEPETIIDGCIKAWQKLLVGFKGRKVVDTEKLHESLDLQPLHFAISLTGEPTMYPKLPQMLDILKDRKISSFLVTNGTIPERVEALIKHQPTQLYVSVYGPNEDVYRKTAMPLPKDGWERLQKTLSMIGEFERSTIRLTLTKGWNMVDPEGYASLLKNVDADFIELKAYMHVGHSRERLEVSAMPRYEEIKLFADKFCKASGLKILDEKPVSRVILVGREDRKDRVMDFN